MGAKHPQKHCMQGNRESQLPSGKAGASRFGGRHERKRDGAVSGWIRNRLSTGCCCFRGGGAAGGAAVLAAAASCRSGPLPQGCCHVGAVPRLRCLVQQEAGAEAVGRQRRQLGWPQARHAREVCVVGTNIPSKVGLWGRASKWEGGQGEEGQVHVHGRVPQPALRRQRMGQAARGRRAPHATYLQPKLLLPCAFQVPALPTGSSLFTVTGTRVSRTSCRSLASRQPRYTCGGAEQGAWRGRTAVDLRRD